MDIILDIEDKRESIGDQDILQEYDKQWEQKKELQLDVKYNMFFPHIDYYTHHCNYGLEDICVVHFIYTQKPFHLKRKEIPEYIESMKKRKESNYKNNKISVLENYISCGEEDEMKILEEYFDILESING